MENMEEAERKPFRARAAHLLDRAENLYLRVLRAAVLIVATLLIGYALFLTVISLYRVAQSPSSVKVAESSVAPEEIVAATPADAPGEKSNGSAQSNPAQVKGYQQFVGRYYQLFRSRFEPFRQAEDKQLTKGEFDDNFVGSETRLKAIASGDLAFEGDMADLNKLYDAMSAAAALPESRRRLEKYKAAKKVQLCRNVERTRTTFERGWDRNSTTCPSWYLEPVGCSVTRPVETPYTARECTMRFPEGTQSHLQLFRAFQDRYNQLLSQRREEAAANADAKRNSIVDGIAKGRLDLFTALLIAGGFVVLMFFFLLIAIERHQRRRPEPLPGA